MIIDKNFNQGNWNEKSAFLLFFKLWSENLHPIVYPDKRIDKLRSPGLYDIELLCGYPMEWKMGKGKSQLKFIASVSTVTTRWEYKFDRCWIRIGRSVYFS